MAKKRKSRVDMEKALRKLSGQIQDLMLGARLLASDIRVRALVVEETAPSGLVHDTVEEINKLLGLARRIEKQDSLMFLFERAYSSTTDKLELLDGQFTSFHERAFKLAYGFLLQVLSYEAEKLDPTERMTFIPPRKLENIDLIVASDIAERHADDLKNELVWSELAVEVPLAANLLANSQKPIPPEYHTRPLTKREAAEYLSRKGSEDGGVRWLNQCIRDGTIRCEPRTRQSFIFDIRAFPLEAQRNILPRKR